MYDETDVLTPVTFVVILCTAMHCCSSRVLDHFAQTNTAVYGVFSVRRLQRL